MSRRVLCGAIWCALSNGLLSALWRTGVWRHMVFLFIYSTGLAIIFPITPTLMTNGFASLAAGRRIDCTAFPPDASPRECVDAHSTVVTWMSITNFISSSLLTFLCAPYVGHLSDRIGRKPFMLVGVALTFLPLAVIQLHLHDLAPIYWYYPASAVGGAVSSFTMTLTAVADLMEQKYRATAVGYLTSCFSLGMLTGPPLGGYLTVTAAMWTCIALTAVTWTYVAVLVPESAPGPLARRTAAKAAANMASGKAGNGGGNQAEREEEEEALSSTAAAEALEAAEAVSLVAAQQHFMSGGAAPAVAADADAADIVDACTAPRLRVSPGGGGGGHGECDAEEALLPCYRFRSGSAGDGGAAAASGGQLAGMSTGWSVIRHSSFYQRIAAIWVVVSMTWEGAGELLMQYLQYRLGYGTRDQAHVLTVLAAGGLVVKLGLLAALVRWLGERRLLALGLAAYAAECLALAAASSKVAGLAAVSVGSLASVCWPALTALQTAGVDPAQQGAVFGALQAISSMASGIGPLLFAAVFRSATRTDSRLPSMPGAVWYLAAALTAIAIALTFSLPEQPFDKQKRAHQAQQDQEQGVQRQQQQHGHGSGGRSGAGGREGDKCSSCGCGAEGRVDGDVEAGLGGGGGSGVGCGGSRRGEENSPAGPETLAVEAGSEGREERGGAGVVEVLRSREGTLREPLLPQ